MPGDYSYWVSQIPFVRDARSAWDTARYWDDYKKNTGVKVLYPGKTYTAGGISTGTSLVTAKMMMKAYRHWW